MTPKPVKVGIVGCGNISGVYFAAGKKFGILDIAACADLDIERAKAKAAEFNVPRACSVKELLADPEIEIVLNLTVPKAHAEVNLAALEAGKHAYTEKPFAVTCADGRKVLKLAASKKLLTGGAPDTFMGAGVQTCRKLIDDGWIGTPVAATAFCMFHGHEGWHPSPEFYYEKGGGPMFDMGPYYVTALVALLGPVRRVAGSTRITFPERTITSQPKAGKRVTVETPTHIAGTLDFASGAIGTIVTSFDIWGHSCPIIEIYGTEGSMKVPDPNGFGGPVQISRPGSQWTELPLAYGYADQNRGIGVADMAHAIRLGRSFRPSGELAFHVLDIMESLHVASDAGRSIKLSSTCQRPAPLPLGLQPGQLEK